QLLAQVQALVMLAHTARSKPAELLGAQANAAGTLDLVAQRAQAGTVDAAGCGKGVHAFQCARHRCRDFPPELPKQFSKCWVGVEVPRKCRTVRWRAGAGVQA
ncbi:MAG: hypothetical protein ACRC2B_24475, partial [Rubrivivax sp.]